ncbi:hypothetical protein [Anaeromyxobacter sp. Fw109-5]|uniref:hypothetical protein n=1 Tax=Anaeromyxobacter sp. (strain Fw109-5) TaxID=404589 RepID=UPI00059C5223|nr:hypothetical protein [Anaeromyxobacter sp. Fw109-5]
MLRTAAALAALLYASHPAADQSPTLPPTVPPGNPAPSAGGPAGPPEPGAAARPTSPARPTHEPVPRGAVLEEVSGTLARVDRQTHRITVSTPEGPVTLSIDRNTMVYTAAGLGSVADLMPGSQLRAGRNADALAYWVQVRRSAKDEPPSTPGQGTGPGGGSGPPAEGEASGAGAAPPTGVGPGGLAPGTAPPGG